MKKHNILMLRSLSRNGCLYRSAGIWQHPIQLVPTRRSSSVNKLFFERKTEHTRPLLQDATIRIRPDSEVKQGHIGVFLGNLSYDIPHTFLRDSCQCSKCIDPSTTQKTFNTGDIDRDIRPLAKRIVNNGLEVIWTDNSHRSVYSAQYILDHTTRSAASHKRHNDHVPMTWDAASIANLPIEHEYKSFMRSQSVVYEVVRNLADYGLSFVNDCPAGPEAELKLGIMALKIGPLKNTFYGMTWNVRSVEQAKNVAYTSVDLDLHMDLLYYESPPGLQFLYCLENQVEGGSSVFVDSFAVAERMRTEYPEEFKILCTYLVDFKYENDAVHYHQARTTFVLNDDTGALEYVNYSPPFQGTQVMEGFQAYQSAISVFAELISRAEFRHELVLKEGQCVIFNNRRTLHARRSFGPGKRWLKGTYCDIDALWSRYRTGRAELTQ